MDSQLTQMLSAPSRNQGPLGPIMSSSAIMATVRRDSRANTINSLMSPGPGLGGRLFSSSRVISVSGRPTLASSSFFSGSLHLRDLELDWSP